MAPQKTFVISKIVKATSLQAALKKESKADIADVRLVVSEGKQFTEAIGFQMDTPSDDDDELDT